MSRTRNLVKKKRGTTNISETFSFLILIMRLSRWTVVVQHDIKALWVTKSQNKARDSLKVTVK